MKLSSKKLDKIRKYAEKILNTKDNYVISNGVSDSWNIIAHDDSDVKLRVRIEELGEENAVCYSPLGLTSEDVKHVSRNWRNP